MVVPSATADGALLRRRFALEYATLGWNVVGIVVLAVAAWSPRSVALAGFGVDSLIEIGASIVVVWEPSGRRDEARQRRALRLIGVAFAGLAAYRWVVRSLRRDGAAARDGRAGGAELAEQVSRRRTAVSR
jgi:hypothetical protein